MNPVSQEVPILQHTQTTHQLTSPETAFWKGKSVSSRNHTASYNLCNIHLVSPEKCQAMNIFSNTEHNCPLALEELNLCPQDCRLDCLKKSSPEEKGSTDQLGTKNGLSHVLCYPHSHPVLPKLQNCSLVQGRSEAST